MDKNNTPITAKTICDKLGRQAIADRVGKTITAVSNASASEKFPAHWYPEIRDMCREAKQACPDTAFSFISGKRAVGNPEVVQRLRSGGRVSPETEAALVEYTAYRANILSGAS